MDKTVCLSRHEIVVDRDMLDAVRKALAVVANWELPHTHKFEGKGKERHELSYGTCYGSNGERDFMKKVANKAFQSLPDPYD